ncbi:MAG TPA: D-alanine--D-alanine ligase [Polyangia bacterium]|jgi:D-alanine-D-alanine ligase|nr:D-alanine--D-alanine ligase [Polyangia bacterium]
MNPRIVVVYNRDFEGAEADPENKAREDIKDIAENIIGILCRHGFAASGLGVTGDVLAAVSTLRELHPDVVFNLCESIGGDNRFEPLLPLLLDREGIAYTGSGPLALTLALHKHKAKDVLRSRGVPTPEAMFMASEDVSGVNLPFPLIVKPSREDASVGIYSESVVHDRLSLERRVATVLSRYRQPALVERYIDGREIYVSLFSQPSGPPQIFPFYEIDFSEMPPGRPHIVSFEGKWIESSDEYRGTKPVRCQGLSPEVEARIRAIVLSAFEAMELRDYARFDIRLALDGTPYIIDVNPNCDLSDIAGGFSKAAKAGGLSYDEVILRLVELALLRRPNVDTIPLSPARTDRRTAVALGTPAEGVATERVSRRRVRSV